jgi:hypothetical protein
VDNISVLTKVDWLAACIALRVGSVILQPMGSKGQGPIPEEIYQILLTNKKQGNLN